MHFFSSQLLDELEPYPPLPQFSSPLLFGSAGKREHKTREGDRDRERGEAAEKRLVEVSTSQLAAWGAPWLYFLLLFHFYAVPNSAALLVPVVVCLVP